MKLLQVLSGSGQWLLSTSPLGVLPGSGNGVRAHAVPTGVVLEQGVTLPYHPGRAGKQWDEEGRRRKWSEEKE